MSSAREIPTRNGGNLTRTVSNSFDHVSTSPVMSFHSPSASFQQRVGASATAAKQLKPFQTQDIKVLLLENVNQTGRTILQQQGYQVEFLKSSLPEDQLIEKIRYAHTKPTIHTIWMANRQHS